MKINFTLLLFALVYTSITFGQDLPAKHSPKFLQKAEDLKSFQDAEIAFQEENYHLALGEYQKLEEKFPNEPVLLFRLGVCYLYKPGNAEKALRYLERLDEKDMRKSNYLLYYGVALYKNYKFKEAIDKFQEFPKNRTLTTGEKFIIDNTTIYCNVGLRLMQNPLPVKITTVNNPVNTVNSESKPLFSADQSVLYFTYRGDKSAGGFQFFPDSKVDGEYADDIFFSKKDSAGQWSVPAPIPGAVNTNFNESCNAISNDGKTLFITRNSNTDNGMLLTSKWDGAKWLEPVLLKGDINSDGWDGNISLSADEHTLYFSSDRQGGFGGRDIYTATLQMDGSWSNIQNLGRTVNTTADDDAPFIHPSGQFLIFSSKGLETIGGYDIFKTTALTDSTWSVPENFGYPVNTIEDDLFYSISADGKQAYSSYELETGPGLKDIYTITPGWLSPAIKIATIKGSATVNEKQKIPVQVVVTKTTAGKESSTIFVSNDSTKAFHFNLAAGAGYQLKFKPEGFEPHVQNLDLTALDSAAVILLDAKFYTPEYLARQKAIKDSIEAVEKSKLDSITNITNKAKQDSINAAIAHLKQQEKEQPALVQKQDSALVAPKDVAADKAVFKESEEEINNNINEWIRRYGNATTAGLIFRVQVGAFNKIGNFDVKKLEKYDKVEHIKSSDKLTRFLIGNFKTINEAIELRKRIIKDGYSDAFIIGIYNGKRYMLRDLIKLKILQDEGAKKTEEKQVASANKKTKKEGKTDSKQTLSKNKPTKEIKKTEPKKSTTKKK
jgi:hypothetical protein